MHEKEPFSGSEVSQDNLSLRKGSSFARTTPDLVHAVNNTSAPEITFYNKKTRVSQFVCEIGRMMEKKKRDNVSATNLHRDRRKRSSDSQEEKKNDYSYQQTAKLALAAPDTNVGTDPLGCIWQLN